MDITRLGGRKETLYIVLGIVNVSLAGLVMIGTLFSSLSFAFYMGLLIELPITLGLAGILLMPRASTCSMLLGCTMIVIYIGNWIHTDIRIGFRPIPFHILWLGLNVSQIFLSILRLKNLKQPEVTPWPH